LDTSKDLLSIYFYVYYAQLYVSYALLVEYI